MKPLLPPVQKKFMTRTDDKHSPMKRLHHDKSAIAKHLIMIDRQL